VKIILGRLALVAAVAAAMLAFAVPASRAGTYGDEKWCAVTNDGGEVLNWDCEYDTPADCEPAVTAGNRGFCAINPYYQPPPPAAPQR